MVKTNFYFRTKTLRFRVLPILRHLQAGNYPAKIARILGIKKQLVYYYVRKIRKAGLIRRQRRSWPSFYRLTSKGKKFLTGGEGGFRGVRLHAFSVKFPVLRGAGVAVDWRRVRMTNWDRFVGSECGLTVEKTSKSLIVHADTIYSTDPQEAALLAGWQCLRCGALLEKKLGIKLGEPQLLRKPHYAVSNPGTRVLGRVMEYSNSDVGKIDCSEGYGEIDYFDPDLAQEYLLMPVRIRRLEKLVGGLTKQIERLVVSLEKLLPPGLPDLSNSQKRAPFSNQDKFVV